MDLLKPERVEQPGMMKSELSDAPRKFASLIFRGILRRHRDNSPPDSPLRDHIFVTFMANPLAVRISRKAARAFRAMFSRKEGTETQGMPKPSSPKTEPGGIETAKADTELFKKHKTEKNRFGMEFVWIPPGEFLMGSPEDEPGRWEGEKQHRVRLTKGFYMQTTPVTQVQYEAVTGKNPSYFKHAGPDCPVENVSWENAKAFAKKLSETTGHDYRLPTEAQWEYACRAGTTTALYSGPIEILGEHNAPALDPIAWYGGNSGVDYEGAYDSSDWNEKQYEHKKAGVHPVGQKQPNPWGMYDMIGNVWEWCEDWFGDYLSENAVDPLGPFYGSGRVVRGGSWIDLAGDCRSAIRLRRGPGYRLRIISFRLVRLP